MNGATIARFAKRWAPTVVIAVLLSLFVWLVLLKAYRIPTESMLPTLDVGDRVLVNRVSYRFGDVGRGEVVVFERPPILEGDEDFIKRVVGLPGETVRFVDSQVYIDDLLVVEPYLFLPDSTNPAGMIPACSQPVVSRDRCVIPDGHVFVMGDNRDDSVDSRDFGPIPINTIIGRAFWRVIPANNVARL